MSVKISIEEKDPDMVKEFALNATIIPVDTLDFNKEVVTFCSGSHAITSVDFDTLYKYDLARESIILKRVNMIGYLKSKRVIIELAIIVYQRDL